MKNRLISVGTTLFLTLLFALSVLFFSANTFLGPYLKTYSEEQKITRQMMKLVEAEEFQFLNRYQLNETVYVAQVRYQGKEWIIWYDRELNLLAQRELSSFKEEEVQKAAKELGLTDWTFSLGWFHEQPAIVLENSQTEILLDYDSLEVVLTYRKKVV